MNFNNINHVTTCKLVQKSLLEHKIILVRYLLTATRLLFRIILNFTLHTKFSISVYFNLTNHVSFGGVGILSYSPSDFDA